MSTLALELDQALNQLDAEKRAVLEARVRSILGPASSSSHPTGSVLAKWHGAFPDFPEHIPDMDHDAMYEDPFADEGGKDGERGAA